MGKKKNIKNNNKKSNNKKIIGVCSIAVIIAVIGIVIFVNSNNSEEKKYFGEKVTMEDSASMDDITEKLMAKNLEALKDSSFEKYKAPEDKDDSTINLRIYDYKVLNIMTEKSKTKDNIIYAYCDYSIKPYNMDTYMVGGGSSDGQWKTDSRFIEIEKQGKDYSIKSYGTGPSTEMANEGFGMKVSGAWTK